MASGAGSGSLAADVLPRLHPLLPGQSHTQLRVGDTIALCVQRQGKFCFVGSEGFVEIGCSLREYDLSATVPWTHIDCLWEVTQKHQYDAQKKLRRYKKAKRRDAAKGESADVMSGDSKHNHISSVANTAMQTNSKTARDSQEAERHELQELIKAQRTEKVSNTARNEEKRGMPITYGETIQLMHIKSRKYMAFHPKRRSSALGCYSVRLEAEGSEDAWLAIGPRHSFQFEGGSVYNHDLLTMHSVKRQLWINVGTSDSVASIGVGQGHGLAAMSSATSAGPAIAVHDEVNAAPSASGFQLVILQSAQAANSDGVGASSANGGGGSGGETAGASAAAANPTMRAGDILALYHCDEERHLIAQWDPAMRQRLNEDPVVFAQSASAERASCNALWQVRSRRGQAPSRRPLAWPATPSPCPQLCPRPTALRQPVLALLAMIRYKRSPGCSSMRSARATGTASSTSPPGAT